MQTILTSASTPYQWHTLTCSGQVWRQSRYAPFPQFCAGLTSDTLAGLEISSLSGCCSLLFFPFPLAALPLIYSSSVVGASVDLSCTSLPRIGLSAPLLLWSISIVNTRYFYIGCLRARRLHIHALLLLKKPPDQSNRRCSSDWSAVSCSLMSIALLLS